MGMHKGETKNFLTMISDKMPGTNKYNSRALFQCKCGNIKAIIIHSVTTGRTKSCGCLQLAYAKMKSYKHGDSETRLYRIWGNMKNRCGNPNYTESQYYGGKGITVCKEWQSDFEAFRDWALNNGYSDSLSIDRIDGNKGYFPDNCRWVDCKTQSRNRRSCIYIEYNGEKKDLTEWCEILNLPAATIRRRVYRGWDKVRALTEPIQTTIRKR